MAAQCVVRAAVVRSRVGYPRVSKSRVRVSASPASRRRVSVAAAFDDTGPGPTHHTPPSIHFLGIGGAGISALAIIALKDGYSVTGSDLRRGEHMDVVESLGAVCFVGHDARNVGGDDVDVGGDNGVYHRDIIKDGKGYTCGERLEETKITKDPTETKRPVPDAVVVSSAVPKDNVELVWARRRGVPIYTRSQWLKRSTAGKSVVAVAGTHGKTSTSAMLATVLLDLGYDVSAVIGGRVRQFPNRANAIGGTDPLFVVEADEYDGAFLGLSPEIALVLNVEFDHPDMFHSLERVVELFKRFVLNVRRAGGVVVANGDDENVVDILQGNNFISFGFGESNDWRATDVTTNQRTGGSDFVITKHNAFVTKVSLKQPGRFAVYNALAAFVAASVAVTRRRESAQTFTNSESVGADSLIMVTRADKSTNSRPQDLYIALTTAIETHTGVERRLQLIGQINDSVFVYDDYAHHPTAVREVLAGVKQVRITFPKSQHCLLPLFEYSRKVLACLPIVQSTLFAPSVYENITKD